MCLITELESMYLLLAVSIVNTNLAYKQEQQQVFMMLTSLLLSTVTHQCLIYLFLLIDSVIPGVLCR